MFVLGALIGLKYPTLEVPALPACVGCRSFFAALAAL